MLWTELTGAPLIAVHAAGPGDAGTQPAIGSRPQSKYRTKARSSTQNSSVGDCLQQNVPGAHTTGLPVASLPQGSPGGAQGPSRRIGTPAADAERRGSATHAGLELAERLTAAASFRPAVDACSNDLADFQKLHDSSEPRPNGMARSMGDLR